MDANTIITLVGSLGFPIAACVYMSLFISKQTENYRDDVKAMNEANKEEVNKLAEAVNNNTLVMQKLIDKLGGYNDGLQ